MLIFDQLKKGDPQLRAIALMVLTGFIVLLAGLWWVQIVSSTDYQANLQTQSYRTVRMPAVRGRILDANGVAMAENRPSYNISLYLEDLRRSFDTAYVKMLSKTRVALRDQAAAAEKQLGRRLKKEERKKFLVSAKDRLAIREQARALVASNVVAQVSARLRQPIPFDAKKFERHYTTRLALPYPILTEVTPAQIALFEEQATAPTGADVELQSLRVYPNESLAAHVLGYLQRDDSSAEGEEAFFSYRLPDYRGLVGVERGYDKELRGTAGTKSVLVNNVGYRETENIWSAAEPGRNVVLTIDLRLQSAAEVALQAARTKTGTVRGAAVVMNVQNGDILAMASYPTFNPNHFVQGISHSEYVAISSLRAELNLATQENYAPGSIFKTIVGLAALESHLNPNEIFEAEENPAERGKAGIRVGNRIWRDTAAPGRYDFRRALALSSNSYFIHTGLRTGVEKIVALGQKFHLGERVGLPTRQEVSGYFPDLRRVQSAWTDGNTANLCIGQDPVLVTPLQVAVVTSAIANGGKVLWPRLVDRFEIPDLIGQPKREPIPRRGPRDELGVSQRSLGILHEAMLADVEESYGTGKAAAVPGLRICGKTGTAQVKNIHGQKTGQITWFASFAPYKNPRYAVVVMVEDGFSGGDTCAPIAGKIYAAIKACETGQVPPRPAMAVIK